MKPQFRQITMIGLFATVLAAAPALPQRRDALSDRDLKALSVMLDTGEKRYRIGEKVPLRMTLANLETRPITIPFRTRQQFDFEVVRDGRRVWNWAHGESFTRGYAPVILGPTERLTFSSTWSQLGNDGKPVPRGTYTVRGFIATGDRRRLAIEERLEIVP
jgi:hypothetical protein